MSIESALARLYCDAEALKRFLGNPEAESLRLGLSARERADLLLINRADLSFAAGSFALKRASHGRRKSLFRRMLDRWRGGLTRKGAM